MNQNNNNIIKELNDSLDEIIDKSKSFEDEIKSIRKVENLNEYCDCNWTRTQNHLVLKRTLNHLTKLAKWSNG